jgi:hypothetical protein
MRFHLLMPILALLAAAGCARNPVINTSQIEPPNATEYNRLLAAQTRKTNQYSGFYQTFQADLTMLTTEVRTAGLRQRAHFLQWDSRQFNMEREKVVEENGAYAKFLLRFYTPERDYDDLDKPKTIWKTYLDYGGSRFEGKVTKIKDKLVELQTLYPNMDRFSTAYEITFNVPMTTVEQGTSKVTLTSSLGTAEFSFPAAK